MKDKIAAKGFEIGILTQKADEFISLTDIARYKSTTEPKGVIANWLSTHDTIDFLATWEEMHNPEFKGLEFQSFKNERGRLYITPQQWIKQTGAMGIKSSRGRYSSGTFAHPDIAFEFASWISPQFKLYIIKEYQRLKQSEHYQQKLDWSVKRDLAKLNYGLHTDAVKEFLIPKILSPAQIRMTYASEADVLNVALFGLTAKEFKEQHPELIGNQRDNATIEQNLIMANLEMSNALWIEENRSQSERLTLLRQLALKQLENLLRSPAAERIKKLAEQST